MLGFLIYDAKVAVLIAVFYMFYRLMLARETFHRVNRVMLLLTAVASFVLPLCVITMHETVTMEATPMITLDELSMDDVAPVAEPVVEMPWWQIALPVLFFIGMLATLGHTLMSMFRILMLIKRSEKHPMPDGITVCVSGNAHVTPFSWMHYIVMNQSDYAEQNTAILAHERGHIRLKHSWDLLLVDTLTALQWFNPAMWMLRSDLRAIHEYEADGAVLSLGINARQYQYLLITKAASIGGYSLANGISHSTLKNRINMMLHKKSQTSHLLKLLALVPIVGLTLAVNAEKVQDVVYADAPEEPSIEEMIAEAQPDAMDMAASETISFKTVLGPDYFPMDGVSVEVVHNGKVVEKTETGSDGTVTLTPAVGSTVRFITNVIEEDPNSDIVTETAEVKEVKVTKEMLAKGGVLVVSFGVSDEVVKIKVHVTAKEDGNPIVGAVAQIAGTKKGSVSDFDGNFTLEANIGSRVEVSYIGYDTKSLIVKKGSSQEYEITLEKESADKSQKVFDVVDEMPEFPGGSNAMFEYLVKNIKYPAEAEKAGIVGRVIATFVVEKDGSVSNAKVVRSVHPALDAEALRLIKGMPKWTPGKQNGEAVSVKFTVPISFHLQGEKAGASKDDDIDKDIKEVVVVGYGDEKPSTERVYVTPQIVNSPYIIVDGKPMDGAKLKDIDPKTIDHMDILKDKAAIEKYGEKAKNGVLIVTTKKK